MRLLWRRRVILLQVCPQFSICCCQALRILILDTGLWKLEEDQSKNYNTIEYWTNLAKLLEEAKFHGVFLADVLGPYDVYGGPRNIDPACKSGAQYPLLDPLYVPQTMIYTSSARLEMLIVFQYDCFRYGLRHQETLFRPHRLHHL